jgi:CheY-like chemotaxis protein/tetratricopeptide (TPR) repeat protein
MDDVMSGWDGAATQPPPIVGARVPPRVLVIGDCIGTGRLLIEGLRCGDSGGRFEVVSVGSRGAGLERICLAGVDCAVLEIHLPDGDRVECLRRIRDERPDLPVIVITAGGPGDVAARALTLSANDYVVTHGTPRPRVIELVREIVARGEVARAIARLAQGVFVGRATEQAVLCGALDDASAGRGQLFLVEGEAGIGKTTLAAQIAAQAERRGLSVVWGRCAEGEGAPAYWPWTQILRSCAEGTGVEELRADCEWGANAVAQLVPEIAARLDVTGVAVGQSALEPDTARFLMFDGIALYLRNLARKRPMLIVVDDLHRADRSSLRLLQFVARELGNAPLLILCAFRDIDLEGNQAAVEAISPLRRVGSILRLRGLCEEEVRAQVGEISHQKVPASFARTIFRRTEGNPFFVAEILRHLLDEDVIYHDGSRWTARSAPEEMRIPAEIRELVARRLARVSDACREVLSVASVIGREFGLEAVARVSDQSVELICGLLDDAVATRVVARIRGPVRDYVFCHGLVRDILYEGLATVRRAELHRQVGEYLESCQPAAAERFPSTLAHHFLRTVDGESQRKAVDYAVRAAARAGGLMAHEEAARQYEIAARALRAVEDGDVGRRVAILLKVSDSWWRAGQIECARTAALHAAEITRTTGPPTALARAALAHAGQLPGFGAVACDQSVVRLLEEALIALGEGESGLHARLMGRLAEELTFSDERERRHSLSEKAVEMARRLGDAAVIASVLKSMHWALWAPEKSEDRLGLADEIIDLAAAAGDGSMRFEGHVLRSFAKLELGEISAVKQELAACSTLAVELRQPYSSWIAASAKVCMAFVEARLDKVEELARQALELGQKAQNPNAALFYGVQLAHLLWLRGRFDALEPIWESIGRAQPPLLPTLQCARAVSYAEIGQLEEARSEFESVAAHGFMLLRRDVTWAQNLTFLAQVCATLRDAPRAGELYELLHPFEGRVVVLAPVLPWGAACHYLGLLAATMGRADLARRHFEDALAMNSRTGSRHWLARTQLAYATMLLEEGSDVEVDRALTLLGEAGEIGSALGMDVFVGNVRAMVERVPARIVPAALDPSASRAEHETPSGEAATDRAETPAREVASEFRCEGRYWTIVHRGTRSVVPDTMGLRLLAVLLGDPEQEFYVRDLLQRIGCSAADARGRAATTGDIRDLGCEAGLDPLLDPRARREYREQVASLQEQIEEAASFNDTVKEGLLRERLQQFREILSAAIGLGGRNRPVCDPEERARQKVRKNIKAAFDLIAGSDPSLGHHLDTHVKTGRYCSYRPDPDRPVRWTT